MAVFGVIVMAAFVLIVVWFVVAVTRPERLRPAGNEALQLLASRYAAGDIGRDEYLERKTDLES